jgi:uncharacterized RDD family membrane protein YckC
MVYQDISKPVNLNQLGAKKSTANLMDRFFSFLIDYFVISPFVFFLLYVTFSNGFVFWQANKTAPENDLFIWILAVTYALYFSLIQSLFIAVCRATPGQFFLKVRIEFSETQNIIFLRAFLRQLGFWFSFIFLGLPFLSVMTNKARRTFYDRISDTFIVSTKEEVNSSPLGFENEFKYWQSFMATMVVFVGLLFASYIWKNYSKVVQRVASFAELQDKRFFCEDLKGVNIDERLAVAVALNLADQLSDECLDKESDFVLWKQRKSDYSLAYYAKSLITQDGEKEKKYLKQACSGQDVYSFEALTLGCKVAYSFLNDKLEELYQDLDAETFLTAALKYELSLNLNKSGEVKANLAKIGQYNTLKIIKKYQVIEMLSQQELTQGRAPASTSSDIEVGARNKIIDLIGEL